MKLYLGAQTLPEYANDGFKEITEPNTAKNVALDGTLYVDFYNNRRKWEIRWDYLTPAEYASIRALYDAQFANEAFTYFGVPALGINVPVYINVVDTNRKWDGRLIQGFSIVLEEQYAVS